MKHLLLITFLSFSTISVMGQSCTANQSFANSGPGVYPQSPATVDCSNILSTKTIVSITDTTLTDPITVTLYYDSSRVVSMTGLPAGLLLGTDVDNITNTSNPFGAWVNGGSIPNLTAAVGCMYIHGTPAAWAAAAAGGVGGTYTLTVLYDAKISQTVPDLTGFGIPPGTWLSAVNPSFGGGLISIDFPLDANPTNTLDATLTGATSVDGSSTYNYSTSTGLSSYVWSVTGGTMQSGQGTNEISVIWDGGNATGNVQVTVGDGTCEETNDLDITSIVTGISKTDAINTRVYPNPGLGIFNIEVESTGTVTVQVFDLAGKSVIASQFTGSKHVLNLEFVQAGIYLLKVRTDVGTAVTRLVKN